MTTRWLRGACVLTAVLLGAPAEAATPEGCYAISWDRASTRYEPRFFTGLLDFDAKTVSFAEGGVEPEMTSMSRNEDGTFLVRLVLGGADLLLAGVVEEGTLGGVVRYAGWPMQPLAGQVVDERAIVDPPEGWSTITPEEAGVDPEALATFVRDASSRHSDAFALTVDGRLLAYRAPRPGPHNVQSITKPVAAMAVAFLIDEARVEGLEQPLGELIDAWKDTPQGAVTLRHVLTHTSGLEREPDARKLINHHPDRAALVLGSPLVDEPGTTFGYSNRAMGLIPVVVRATTGESLRDYLAPRLFEPLGVVPIWSTDAAGSTTAFGGLQLSVVDLLRLGQLMLDDGKVQGKQVLPKGWVKQATTHGGGDVAPQLGLSWFVSPDGTFGHSGSGGQYLMVDPATGLVFARLHAWHGDAPSGHEGPTLSAAAFELLR